MLGIAHHSPWVISVFLDRNQFRELLVTEAAFTTGEWRETVEAFSSSPSDGRERVLFVETVEGVRTMKRQGFDPESVKLAVYDTIEALQQLPEVDLVDHRDGDALKLDLNDFNAALGVTAPGIPDRLVRDPEGPASKTKQPKAKQPIDTTGAVEPTSQNPPPKQPKKQPKKKKPVSDAPEATTSKPAAQPPAEQPPAKTPTEPAGRRKKPRKRQPVEPKSYELF